jgi:ribose transport system substrate-binding protein
MLKHVVALACCAALLLSCDNSNKSDPNAKKTIGVVPKGTAHIFWRSVKAGADKAGKELGVDIKWDGPPSEDQRAKQIEIIESMQSRGIDALVVAPLDATAITATMEKAKKSMPVVVFDSGSTFKDYDAFVATDNFKGGQLAGQHMLKLIGDKEVELAMVRYDSASDSTNEREKGFLDAIKGNTKIKVYSDQYAGSSADKATTLMSNLLQAHPKITAVFASNESTARGALGALEKAGLAGKITFIGFDSSPELLAGLEKGNIQALVLQDPVRMGYMAVKAALAAMKKEAVTREQPIEPVLATPENMNKPEVKSLLRPEL